MVDEKEEEELEFDFPLGSVAVQWWRDVALAFAEETRRHPHVFQHIPAKVGGGGRSTQPPRIDPASPSPSSLPPSLLSLIHI